MIGIQHDSTSPQRRRGMSTFQLVLGSVLWLCVLTAVAWIIVSGKPSGSASSTAGATSSAVSGSALPERSSIVVEPNAASVKLSFPSRELPEFEFPECMGATVSRDGLKGQPWVASFVFTRCVTTCPMITREVMDLHRRVAESSPDVKFVSFSVDPNFDTAEVLKKYAEIFSADHERWKFVTGDEQKIHDLIREGFTLAVMPNLGNERKPGFEVAHTNRVVLVNENSIPVATFLATNPEDMVKLRRILEKKDEFPAPGPLLSVNDGNGSAASGAAPEIGVQLKKIISDGEVAGTGTPTPENGDAAKNADPESADQMSENAEEESADTGTLTDGQKIERINRQMPEWSRGLPEVNAVLNLCCTALLMLGYVAIRLRRIRTHRFLMVTAFLVSTAFLASYLTYHYALGKYTGLHGRPFQGSATATVVYRCILWPHVILAAFVPFMAMRVFLHALREHWEKHRLLARVTLPIWLFVSVTGVIIYLMLYRWPWQVVN